MPCSPARARQLLKKGRAVIHRTAPFTIRLTDRATGEVQPVLVKIDPGARTTGIAVVRANQKNPQRQSVLVKLELEHRGTQIRDALTQRAALRRTRRSRNLRYRAPRFLNRGGAKKQGWLPPSLRHRIETTCSWVNRLRQWVPVSGLAAERVRFDTQALLNPEIEGVEYQQGELAGYEVREYLLEKHGRKCAYCDTKETPLQIEHIVPRSRGGSNRVSNLTLACPKCNAKKGNRPIEAFLAKDPERAKRIKAQAQAPLSSAAAVNATRFVLIRALAVTGLPVETSTGGRTKYNRCRLGISKSHANDAACVGEVEEVRGTARATIAVKAMGRGSRKRTSLTKYGFPRGRYASEKMHFGFRTGDRVRAVVPSGKKEGGHTGRVMVRATGFFDIRATNGRVDGISHKYCRILQRADGYAYSFHVQQSTNRRSSSPSRARRLPRLSNR
jgi:5-methylcytosine-specific restriction endonuclease McrA